LHDVDNGMVQLEEKPKESVEEHKAISPAQVSD